MIKHTRPIPSCFGLSRLTRSLTRPHLLPQVPTGLSLSHCMLLSWQRCCCPTPYTSCPLNGRALVTASMRAGQQVGGWLGGRVTYMEGPSALRRGRPVSRQTDRPRGGSSFRTDSQQKQVCRTGLCIFAWSGIVQHAAVCPVAAARDSHISDAAAVSHGILICT